MHRFSTAEEELLLALADQAAIALEHARLYAEQERVVAERTRELDAQKRFVEVVLETMPLGVFVLDAGARAWCGPTARAPARSAATRPRAAFRPVVPDARAASVAGLPARGVPRRQCQRSRRS